MGRFDSTKTAIDVNITQNGNQEITGSILNSVLNNMVDATDAQLDILQEAIPTKLSDLEQDIPIGSYDDTELRQELTELSAEVGGKQSALFANEELNDLIKEIYVIKTSFDYTKVARVRAVVGYLAGDKYYNAIYFHANNNSLILSAQNTYTTEAEAFAAWNESNLFVVEGLMYAIVMPVDTQQELDFRNEKISHPLTIEFAPSISSHLSNSVVNQFDARLKNNEIALISCAKEVKGANLFDKRRVKKGIIAGSGIVDNSNYYYSHPIYCTAGTYKQTYSSQLGSVAVYAICTSNGEFIKGYSSGKEDGYYIYTISEPCYIMINIGKKADLDAVMFCEYEQFPDEYTPYTATLEYSNIPIANIIGVDALNPLANKKMLICGDSIAYGGGRGFGLLIGEKNGMQVTTNAIDGAIITIGGDSTKSRIYQQLLNGAEGMDYVIFDGGVNDMTNDNLGEIEKSFTAEFNEETFCGSFEKLISTMIAKYPTAKMGYVAVHRIKQWKDDNFTAWQDTGYYSKAIEICRKWGIPVCDLTHEIPSLYEIAALKDAYTRNKDGWHPTEDGYRVFYCDKIEAWMKSL